MYMLFVIEIGLEHKKKSSVLLKNRPILRMGRFQAVEKVQLSRAFSRLSGKMDMGDAKCLNAGKWTVI